MGSKRVLSVLLVAILVALAPLRAGQNRPPDGYAIGPQDQLAIVCTNDPSVSGKFLVQSDGTISVQYLGSVKVEGLTAPDVEQLLRKRFLDAGTFSDPKISVAVESYKSQKVFVSGEVRTPGAYPILGSMNLLELISQAGQVTAAASGEVTIVRLNASGQQELINRNINNIGNELANIAVPLRNGDLVIVQQADKAYIVGEVKNPNGYPVRPGTTLIQLLSLAGGPTVDAATNRISITRIVNGKEQVIKNAKNQEVIKPGDTILVPVRRF